MINGNLLKNLHIYKSILKEEYDKEFFLDELFKESLEFFEKCFLLYNVSFYIRNKDFSLLKKYEKEIMGYSKEILETYLSEQNNYFFEDKGVFTSNVGAAFGALYNINLILKEEMIASEIIGMKAKMYELNTDKGMLVSKSNSSLLSIDVFFAVVPFCLFTPEDLVLIEFLNKIHKELESKEGISFNKNMKPNSFASAILAWYYTEKADYNKAQKYMQNISVTDSSSIIIEIIEVIKKNKKVKILPLIHNPLGNFNRYERQPFERNPWIVNEGENFEINCVINTDMISHNVVLKVKLSNKTLELKPRINDNGRLNYLVQGINGEEDIEYWFEENYKIISEIYSFKLNKIEKINCFKQVIYKEKTIEGYFIAHGKNYKLLFEQGKPSSLKIQEIEEIIIEDKLINSSHLMAIVQDKLSLLIDSLEVYSNGHIKINFVAQKDTGYYGFGQRYNHINQKGNMVDNYVYNQYKDQGIKTYIPMPYFLTNKNFGMLLKSSMYAEFDLEKTSEDIFSIYLEDKSIELSIFEGNPYEMYSQYISQIGKPVMVPKWVLGPWMSSNNWDNQKEVEYQLEQTIKYDIPSTVLVIEAWSDEATYYVFNDAVYEENKGDKSLLYNDYKFPEWGRWPNPKAMVDKLHENNIKCILWQIPILKHTSGLLNIQLENDKKYAIEKGYTAKNPDGSEYRMPEGWFTDSILFDYTNPDANDWWFSKRKYLVEDLKIDGFKTDGGEFVFGNDVKFSDGRTGRELRNEYPNLYISKYYNFAQKNNGITFSRAGYLGAGRMPAHWAGDERSTFDAFKRNLCAGINASMSGIVFWGWDLGGFSGEIPSAELFARSTSMACFCPIMQYHAESKAQFNQDRTPWNIAERREAPWVIDMYRFYAHLRMSMMDYIEEQSINSIENNKPLMRALLFDYSEDERLWDIYDEYMFGDDILVAPIIEEGATERLVYLPEGNWINIFDEKVYQGKKDYLISANLFEIPVFIKENSKYEFYRENNIMKVGKK